jgi:hypothetical protein
MAAMTQTNLFAWAASIQPPAELSELSSFWGPLPCS